MGAFSYNDQANKQYLHESINRTAKPAALGSRLQYHLCRTYASSSQGPPPPPGSSRGDEDAQEDKKKTAELFEQAKEKVSFGGGDCSLYIYKSPTNSLLSSFLLTHIHTQVETMWEKNKESATEAKESIADAAAAAKEKAKDTWEASKDKVKQATQVKKSKIKPVVAISELCFAPT